ncbi:hypothetical protein GCM10009613_15200 [Pseudonocardia kongjuensis]|uniref:Uncharacterized protein n=1 Tax=Pseudonocardia kongjuensis TaxID=102227 RepID=A0ABN1XNT7_9PSEU
MRSSSHEGPIRATTADERPTAATSFRSNLPRLLRNKRVEVDLVVAEPIHQQPGDQARSERLVGAAIADKDRGHPLIIRAVTGGEHIPVRASRGRAQCPVPVGLRRWHAG